MNEIVNRSERSETALPNDCVGSFFPQSANITKAEA